MERARLLVVDDVAEVRASLRRLLLTRGDEVRVAATGSEGLEVALEWRPHCILLDYVMPGMSGEEFVARFREHDHLTQIILVTGHSGEHPAREMMRRLDIQGYQVKGADLEPLMVSIDVAIKTHERLSLLARQSEAMRRILESSPSLQRFLPPSELCRIAMEHLQSLIGASGPTSRAAIATVELDGALVVRAVGRGANPVRRLEDLPEDLREALARAPGARTAEQTGAVASVPIVFGDQCLGAIAVELPAGGAALRDPLLLFAHQIGLALQNARLHESATVDSLTQLHSRGHLLERLDKWLCLSVREQRPLSLVFVDLDNLKPINDRLGHLAGDAALAAIGAQILQIIRETDVAGRFGGDEFLIVAPHTSAAGAAVLAERVRSSIAATAVELEGERVGLTASVAYAGFGALALDGWMRGRLPEGAWSELSRAFIALADEALYAAKVAGRNRVAAAGRDGAVDDRLVELAHRLAPHGK